MQPRLARALVRCAALLPLLALGGLGACQSRLLGAKTHDYDLPRGPSSGIPFRLARPVFIIQRSLKTDATTGVKSLDKWELVVEYRSDPSAVYWVNIDPAAAHESKLTLSFMRLSAAAADEDSTSHGFLTGLSAETKDKSSGFIEAIGKFATEAIGLYVLAEGNAQANGAKTLAGASLVALANSYQAFGFSTPEEALAPVSLELAIRLGDVPVFPSDPSRRAQDRVLEVLTPGAKIDASDGAAAGLLQERALAALPATLFQKMEEFRNATGIDLLRLYGLYKDFPSLAGVLLDALPRPKVLPGHPMTEGDLAALKTLLRSAFSVVVPMSGGFELNAYHTANIQAHLQLLSHHRFLDAMEKRLQPSDPYLEVERRLYAAANWASGWEERRRLKSFLASATPIYEAGSPSAPDPGFINELEKASKRIQEIDRQILALVTEPALWKDPSAPSVSIAPPGALVSDWTDLEKKPLRPRWVYQESIPGPIDRATWLQGYLDQFQHGKDPEDGEFVVLVERSYPDREVLPDGRFLGQYAEVKLAAKPAHGPCEGGADCPPKTK